MKGKRGNARATFKAVQREHLKLLDNPATAKLPSGERNRLVAEKLGLRKDTVSAARFGVSKYSKFAGKVDPRLVDRKRQDRGGKNREELFNTIQRLHLELASDPEHRDKDWSERDGLIAKMLSVPGNPISRSVILRARLGIREYTPFAKRVNEALRGTRHLDALERFQQVQKAHITLLDDPEHGQKSLSERDSLVAEKLGLAPMTVYLARIGEASYQTFKKKTDPRLAPTRRNPLEENFERVQAEFKAINSHPMLHLMDLGHKDELAAKRLGLGLEITKQARKANGPYARFKAKADPSLVREEARLKTFLTVMHAYEKFLKHPASLGMAPREMDAFVARKLGLSATYVSNARTLNSYFKAYDGFVPGEVKQLRQRTKRETFDLVQRMHEEMRDHPDYKGLILSERDNVIAARLGMNRTVVSSARRGMRQFSGFAGLVPEDLRGDSLPGRKRTQKPPERMIGVIPTRMVFDALKSRLGDDYFGKVMTLEQRQKARENFRLVLSPREQAEFREYWAKRFPDVRFDSKKVLQNELARLKEQESALGEEKQAYPGKRGIGGAKQEALRELSRKEAKKQETLRAIGQKYGKRL